MSLEQGTKLGPYEIVGAAGARSCTTHRSPELGIGRAR